MYMGPSLRYCLWLQLLPLVHHRRRRRHRQLWAFLDPDGQTLSEHLMDIHTVHVDPGGVPELVPQKKKKKKE